MRYAITAESGGERILKIIQHLRKLWAKFKVGVFFQTQCIVSYISCAVVVPFKALTLLVGQQEGHPACKKLLGVGVLVC